MNVLQDNSRKPIDFGPNRSTPRGQVKGQIVKHASIDFKLVRNDPWACEDGETRRRRDKLLAQHVSTCFTYEMKTNFEVNRLTCSRVIVRTNGQTDGHIDLNTPLSKVTNVLTPSYLCHETFPTDFCQHFLTQFSYVFIIGSNFIYYNCKAINSLSILF